MGQVSLQQVIGKLENLFSIFNKEFYGDKLQTPVITASPDHTKGAYGWCTGWKAWKAWKGADEGGYYEINLCAEHLSRPFLDVCETLIHEMVHLHNLQEGVKDTSRGGTYHNKEFKTAAEAHGLTVSKTKSGWTKTALTKETALWLQSTFNGEEGFTLYREKLLKLGAAGKKKSSSRKYVCPCCGVIVRATKEVNITCSDCDEAFEEVV